MLIYTDHLILRHISPILMLIYTDRYISLILMLVYADHLIFPSHPPILMLIYADHPIFPSHPPILMLVYADHRISPFEGGWGDVFDVLFKGAIFNHPPTNKSPH